MNIIKEEFVIIEWRKRLRFMADIVFATAMTIMILNIEIPNIESITVPEEITKIMFDQLSNMMVFFIAFMTVSVYWVKHLEHFSITLKVNQTYIMIQLLFLVTIMLVPFWSTYVSKAPENVAIKILFSCNLIAIGALSYIGMHYAASRKHRLIHKNVTDLELKEAKKQILTEPIIAAVAVCLIYIHPVLWDIAFVMIPILFSVRKRLIKVNYFSHKEKNKSDLK